MALVVGVEKFTDKLGSDVDTALATTGDSDFEAVQGMTPTAQAALLMKRYIHENDIPSDGFAGFALTAHANAVNNPYAMFRKAIKPETYAKAEMVSEPLAGKRHLELGQSGTVLPQDVLQVGRPRLRRTDVQVDRGAGGGHEDIVGANVGRPERPTRLIP